MVFFFHSLFAFFFVFSVRGDISVGIPSVRYCENVDDLDFAIHREDRTVSADAKPVAFAALKFLHIQILPLRVVRKLPESLPESGGRFCLHPAKVFNGLFSVGDLHRSALSVDVNTIAKSYNIIKLKALVFDFFSGRSAIVRGTV
jgi:hypothetical protein